MSKSTIPSDTRLRPPALSSQPTSSQPTRTSTPTPTTPTSLNSSINVSTALDDRATASYIRRTLLAQHTALSSGTGSGPPKPIHELLPTLTNSDAVDLQLYGMIAVLLKEFVALWYSKITPDHVFVEEILKVIAHGTREAEDRARRVDWEGWLIDEAPSLIEAHIRDYRFAHQHQSGPISNSPRRIYHTLHPHPALAPVPDNPTDPTVISRQEDNERAWRHLMALGVLTVLLPADDLQNGCLRELVTEILAELILGNVVGNRLCEGWTLWQLITNLIISAQSQKETKSKSGASASVGSDLGRGKKRNSNEKSTDSNNSKNRLEKFGLLNGPAHESPAQSAVINEGSVPQTLKPLSTGSSSFTNTLWTLLNYGFLVITAGRAVLITLLSASSLPPRSNYRNSLAEADKEKKVLSPTPRPLLDMGIWRLSVNLIELPIRMPWLAGLLSLVRWTAIRGPSAVGETDGKLDRILAQLLHTRILDPNRVVPLLRTARHILFPTNTFPRHRQPPPTDEQVREIRAQCARTVLGVIPAAVRRVYFSGPESEQLNVVDGWLSTLEDAYLNKHLVFKLLESLVAKILPELAERDVDSLYEEKVSIVKA